MRKNGFTLIELLAVIVILAILVLLATPAVTSLMTKSNKNSFKNEVLGFVSDINNAYTSKVGDSISSKSSGKEITTVNYKYTVEGGDEKTERYSYLCMNLSDLVSEQYTKKDLGTSYQGYIAIFQPDDKKNQPKVFIYATNGKYLLAGLEGEVSAADPVQMPSVPSDKAAKVKELFECPTEGIDTKVSNLLNTVKTDSSKTASEVALTQVDDAAKATGD